MNKVFVIVSDSNYLEHAKYLFSSVKLTGNWSGDFCLIANNVDDSLLTDFKKYGVKILHRNIENYYYANFFVFDEYFKNWDFVTYMDCDFTIFGDINKIVNGDDLKKPLLHVEMEPFRVHQYFCQGWVETEKNKSLKGLREIYDLDKFGFNAGHLSFNTSIINENTLSDLIKLSESLKNINNHCTIGSDQPIFNLYFSDKIKEITSQKVSFWRGSTKDTIAQHHLHAEAPWVNTEYSDRLKKTYKENYDEFLYDFYKSIK